MDSHMVERIFAAEQEIKEHRFRDLKWKKDSRHQAKNFETLLTQVVEMQINTTYQLSDVSKALDKCATSIEETNSAVASLTAVTAPAVKITTGIQEAKNTWRNAKWLVAILLTGILLFSDAITYINTGLKKFTTMFPGG